MTTELNSTPINERPNTFQIRVRGQLDRQWSDWLEGLTILPEEYGTTLLTGLVVDDAALYGLLKTIRDAGLQLLSVNPIGPGQEEEVDRIRTGGPSSENGMREGPE